MQDSSKIVAYCNNNPVLYSDLTGKLVKKNGITKWISQKIAAVIATITGQIFLNAIVNNITCFFSVGGIIGIALDYFTDKKVDKKIRI